MCREAVACRAVLVFLLAGACTGRRPEFAPGHESTPSIPRAAPGADRAVLEAGEFQLEQHRIPGLDCPIGREPYAPKPTTPERRAEFRGEFDPTQLPSIDLCPEPAWIARRVKGLAGERFQMFPSEIWEIQFRGRRTFTITPGMYHAEVEFLDECGRLVCRLADSSGSADPCCSSIDRELGESPRRLIWRDSRQRAPR